jgi:hypothetical protein
MFTATPNAMQLHTHHPQMLITQGELKEKRSQLIDLQRNAQEIKLEHEFQMRLKDMSCNEKLKELSDKFAQELEALKIMTAVLRTEKEKDEVKHVEELYAVRAKQYQTINVCVCVCV